MRIVSKRSGNGGESEPYTTKPMASRYWIPKPKYRFMLPTGLRFLVSSSIFLLGASASAQVSKKGNTAQGTTLSSKPNAHARTKTPKGYILCPNTGFPLLQANNRSSDSFNYYRPGIILRSRSMKNPVKRVECRYRQAGKEAFRIVVKWKAYPVGPGPSLRCTDKPWNVAKGARYMFESGEKGIRISISRHSLGGNQYSSHLNREQRDTAAQFLWKQVEPFAYPCRAGFF